MAVEVCLHTDRRKAICSLSLSGGLSLGCSSWMRRTGAQPDTFIVCYLATCMKALSGRPGQRPGLGHRHALHPMHAVCDPEATVAGDQSAKRPDKAVSRRSLCYLEIKGQ